MRTGEMKNGKSFQSFFGKGGFAFKHHQGKKSFVEQISPSWMKK